MVQGSSPSGSPPTPSDNSTHKCVMSCSEAQQPKGLSGEGAFLFVNGYELAMTRWMQRGRGLRTRKCLLMRNLRLTLDLD